ncbi:hypothetical protein PR048_008861 [Dryococelus australis]|uniref:DDE-1 domain-containing protein n=1 Tax=Dryococelus australis TaxID=614101 RepID=A0ABQ9HYA7_9NEOP|nr:hypothetical protein PR048_008861 [Dryococelus australis]
MMHFVDHVKPTPDDSVALMLDGHNSYTRTIDANGTGRKRGVFIVCLPPDSTHRLHSLASFIDTLKMSLSQWEKLISVKQLLRTLYMVSEMFLGPSEISPPPLLKTWPASATTLTQPGKTSLITSSPYKRQLDESLSRTSTTKKLSSEWHYQKGKAHPNAQH